MYTQKTKPLAKCHWRQKLNLWIALKFFFIYLQLKYVASLAA